MPAKLLTNEMKQHVVATNATSYGKADVRERLVQAKKEQLEEEGYAAINVKVDPSQVNSYFATTLFDPDLVAVNNARHKTGTRESQESSLIAATSFALVTTAQVYRIATDAATKKWARSSCHD